MAEQKKAEPALADILKFQLNQATAKAAEAAPVASDAKLSQNEMIAQAILGLAPILAGAALGGARGGAIGAEAGLAGLSRLEAGKKEKKAEEAQAAAAKREAVKAAIDLAKEERLSAAEQRAMTAEQRAAARDIEKLGLEKQRVEIERGKAGKEKQPAATQFQAGLYARRVEQAQDVFNQLEKAGFDRSQMAIGVESALPQVLKSPQLQSQEQAEKNFVNALLRRESGAAIAKSEFESAEKQYFPRAGDSPEVLAQKKANRLQAIAGLKAEAGPALEQIPLVRVEASAARAAKAFGAGDAAAAPAKPDFQSMSPEQLKSYLGIE